MSKCKKICKKIIVMLLSVIMVIGMLAGCGDSEANKKKETPADATSKAEESKVSKEESKTVVEEPEELEYVKLKMVLIGEPKAEAGEVFLEKVNEKLMRDLNCEIEWQCIGWGVWQDQYPLMLSAGEQFDIIYTADWASYADNARKGAFKELTEEDFQKYMPRTLEAASDLLNSVKVDGKIYMLPQTKASFYDASWMAVRGDIMKEAGIEDITSVQELEPYLDYVVKNYPSMNVLNVNNYSSAKFASQLAILYYEDETGFDAVSEDHMIGHASGSSIKIAAPYILDLSNKADIKYYDEEVVDEYYLKIYKKTREWLQKGYWSEDCLASNVAFGDLYVAGNGATAMEKFYAVAGWAKSLRANEPEADARIIRLTDNYPLYQCPGTSNGIAISATSKDPERAMMVCDLLGYEQEYVDLRRYGLEGVHYTITEEGRVDRFAEPEYAWSIPNDAFLTSAVRDSNTEIPEYYDIPEAVGRFTPDYVGFLFDPSEVVNEYAAINEVHARYWPILNAGLVEDVESYYYEYKQAMKNAGLDAVLEAQLVQIQEYFDSLN